MFWFTDIRIKNLKVIVGQKYNRSHYGSNKFSFYTDHEEIKT